MHVKIENISYIIILHLPNLTLDYSQLPLSWCKQNVIEMQKGQSNIKFIQLQNAIELNKRE